MTKDSAFIKHQLNGITIEQRSTDGYLNATKLTKAYEAGTGIRKDVRDWLITERAKSYIQYLSEKTGIPVFSLIEQKQGRNGRTWLHPKLATPFATWLSVEYEFQVSEWVEQWMTTGQNPVWSQADSDRVEYRDALKDEARLRMTDQVKIYLEQIRRYDDKKYRGIFFAKVHNALNTLITTETSKQMRARLSQLLGREVKECELIRDYFPAIVLQRYISMCEATANLMIREGFEPLTAVERAAEIVLPANYLSVPIDFAEHINFVRGRLTGGDNRFWDNDQIVFGTPSFRR
jgi:hypothetical protein